MLHIALPNKGTLADAAIALVAEAGYRSSRTGRELCIPDPGNDVEFFFLRPRDIAVYVSQGVIDVGITGRDLNLDAATPAAEILPLGFGRSTFRYAVPRESDLTPDRFGGLRVACSYPNIVRRDLESRGVQAKIVQVDGAVEVSIRLGVADAVADVVDSGQTLREAGLKPVGDPVLASEAIVIARSAEDASHPQVEKFLKRIQGIIVAREYAMFEYNIRRERLDKAVVLTPGIEAPTISPLNDPAWVAVKSMAKKKGMNALIDALSDIGAKGIVVTDIRTCRL
ncbi:MAG: ATP phosphoribosyltransferase [Kiritimatiellia bacterium]|jgi:ATP phosphoribosyltransferase